MLVTSKDYARLFPSHSWDAVRKRFQRIKARLKKEKGQYLTLGEVARAEGMTEDEARRAIFPRKGDQG